MNQLQVFQNQEFGQVRTIEENGKVLFCGSDVAKALGYVNPNKAINDHCRAITKRSTPISGKNQEINFIPEGDLYRLITNSQLPAAEKFELWVFDEVLPAIRKNGIYVVHGYQTKATSVGEVVNLINMTRQSMKDQGCDPREIAIAVKQICEQFSIQLPDCFIRPKDTTFNDAMNMIAFVYSKSKQENKRMNVGYEDFIIVETNIKRLKG